MSFISEKEIINILENSSDEELDGAPDTYIESSDSESDHESEASEQTDCQEGTSTDNEFPAGEEYVSKEGTTWSSIPPRTGRVRAHNIIKGFMGKVSLPAKLNVESQTESYTLFINDTIVDTIVQYTNMELERTCRTSEQGDAIQWKPCDRQEMYAFFGLLLTAGHLKSNFSNYESLWEKLYGPPIFRATMGIKRFKFFLRFLRFDDKGTRAERRRNDKLAPIRDVWDEINNNLKKYYVPGENLTVDEQLVPFRGRCPFRQYIPSKPDKYGMKIWWICDSETFYPLLGIPYLGKGDKRAYNLASSVVLSLTENFKGSNRNITCDNYFTDLKLAQTLLSNGLTLVGTVRKNKKFLPSAFLPNRSRVEGSALFGFRENATLVSFVPKKNKSVILLSTMHHSGEISENGKPEIISYYNATKGGVDSLDQLVHEYTCKRKTNRWPFAYLMNGLDICGVAAYVIWCSLNPDWNKNKLNKRRIFIMSLAEGLIKAQIQSRSLQGLQRPTQAAIAVFHAEEENNSTTDIPRKKKRCFMCPAAKGRMQKQFCHKCCRPVCSEHSRKSVVCSKCKK
jgi:hypothetical protein